MCGVIREDIFTVGKNMVVTHFFFHSNGSVLEDIQALPDISLSLVVISHAVFSIVVPRVTTSYDDIIRYHSSRPLYVFFCSNEYKYKPFDSIRGERDHPARSNRQHTVASLLSLSHLDLVEYTSSTNTRRASFRVASHNRRPFDASIVVSFVSQQTRRGIDSLHQMNEELLAFSSFFAREGTVCSGNFARCWILSLMRPHVLLFLKIMA